MQLNLRVHIGFSKIRFVHFATPQNQMSKSERNQCPELKTNYFQILSLAAYNTCICSSSFFKLYFNIIITFRFITYHISVSYPMEPLLMSKASDPIFLQRYSLKFVYHSNNLLIQNFYKSLCLRRQSAYCQYPVESTLFLLLVLLPSRME